MCELQKKISAISEGTGADCIGPGSEEKRLASLLRRVLRDEYRDGFRNRRDLDRIVVNWKLEVDRLPDKEGARRLLSAVRPLLKGYDRLSLGERQHVVIQVGQDLTRLLDDPKGGVGGDNRESVVTLAVASPRPRKPTISLDSDLQFLKGVGPKMAGRLKRLGLFTVRDLLHHYPRRWEDRTRVRQVRALREGVVETVRGVLREPMVKRPRPGLVIVQAALEDETGRVWLTWFNQPYLVKQLPTGKTVTATGKVERRFQIQMMNPDLELGREGAQTGRIVPVYPLTSSVTQRWIRKLQYWVVPTYAPLVSGTVPESVLKQESLLCSLPDYSTALLEYHWPPDYKRLDRARRRLAFEELFLLQFEVAYKRRTREREPRILEYSWLDEGVRSEFVGFLPFHLTGAQERVIAEIMDDLRLKTPMNRLLQGDVGAGKTVVAAFACFVAIRNGYQAALMAPTEILAEQHYKKLKHLLEPAGISVGLLTGSLRKKVKREVYQKVADGTLQLLVGTHALIQEELEFKALSMVVVDEQHKFGVMQRTTLRLKGKNPDLLVMTATPIPRTLALTLYGDLEVSRLDELPPGRQPIRSQSVPFSQRNQVYELIRREVNAGRQAYIVCPLVEESDRLEATAAVEQAEVLQNKVFPEFSVGLLHGKMKAAVKEEIMEDFRSGKFQILISTTVIEVGVDVPNATVMLVQDADRFGLAQLHQLRGRVGRGEHPSYCIFMGDPSSRESYRRLQAIARLSDGFEVAEEDLQIRGPGDYYGFRQSGFPDFKAADLLRDQDLLDIARNMARKLLANDPELTAPEHKLLRDYLNLRNLKTADIIH